LTLQVVGADSISTSTSSALNHPGALETHVHLHVRVLRSNSASCPVGRTGSIFLTQFHIRAGAHSQVIVDLCCLRDAFTNDLWTFAADDGAVRVVLVGSAFRFGGRKQQPPATGNSPTEITITG